MVLNHCLIIIYQIKNASAIKLCENLQFVFVLFSIHLTKSFTPFRLCYKSLIFLYANECFVIKNSFFEKIAIPVA